jgi:predicted permease
MLFDLKLAFRSLLKSPGFTLVAVLILALCIGANTAIFTVLKKVVLDPLAFPHSERLIVFHNSYPGAGVPRIANAIPDYFDRKQLTDVFESVALWSGTGFEFGSAGQPQRISGEAVTPDYFQVLQASPMLGRRFSAEEAVPGKDKAAILSYGIWREQFASDPDILGKDIRLDGVPYRVVGVMPAGFSGPLHRDSVIWIPLAFAPEMTSEKWRHTNNWEMIGRLRPGVSLEQAQRRVDALNKANLDRFPQFRQLAVDSRYTTLISSMKDELVGEVRSTLYLLQAAAALVLLIGCVNIAGLLLVRSSVRMKELAIRFSLGAGRGVLARQLLTESLALAVMGGIAGMLIAFIGVHALTYFGADQLPRIAGISLDGSALAFNILAAVATGLVFGALPIRNLWRQDLARAFHANERTGTAERSVLQSRSILVISQISLAFVLLVIAGLLAFSFARLLQVNPGFHSAGVSTVEIALPFTRYNENDAARNLIAGLVGRLQRTPGIEQAAVTTYLPFTGKHMEAVIRVDGEMPTPGTSLQAPKYNFVSAGYFKTLGIPLRQGRAIEDADGESSPVVVIDEMVAHRYWPKGNALGARIGLFLAGPMVTVVGVVGGVKTASLAERDTAGQIYLSYKQFPPRELYLAARGKASEAALFNAMRLAVAQSDPQLPIVNARTMTERISISMAQVRTAMVLCSIFGMLAALLAAIGVYGVLAYSVSQRTREFGIRLALGAQAQGLLRSVLWQGFKIAMAGSVIGGIAAMALTRFVGRLLYEVTPTDPMIFAVIALLLAAVTLLSCYVPARRVTKVDPMVALRAE